MTIWERDITKTNQQTNLAIKGTFASVINSILIPIAVSYWVKRNLYGVGGLSADIFFLGITNSFIPAITGILDVGYYISLVLGWVAKRPDSKLGVNQDELNAKIQYVEFEPGYDALPVVNSFLFACFFAPLQPIVVVFALVGNLMIYQTQKYAIFNHKRRPTPGGNMVNRGIWSMIRLGPLAYSIGTSLDISRQLFLVSFFLRED